jgi:hypothetical protein
VANSVPEAESLLKKHHELSDEISQIYAEVSVKYRETFCIVVFENISLLSA